MEAVDNVVPIRGRRLDKRGFADHLGMSVSWIEKRTQEGMPHEEIGNRIRFEPTEAEAWLVGHGLIKAKGAAA